MTPVGGLDAWAGPRDSSSRVGASGASFGFVLTRRLAFGGTVPQQYVDFTDKMLSATPFDVIAEFFPGFGTFDKADALDALADVPTTVIGGTLDQITPISHTQRIAELLPTATLVEVTGAGHMVLLECHDEVNDAIAALIERASRPMSDLRVDEATSADAEAVTAVIHRAFAARPCTGSTVDCARRDGRDRYVRSSSASGGLLVRRLDQAVGAVLFDTERPGQLGLRRVSVDPFRAGPRGRIGDGRRGRRRGRVAEIWTGCG